MDPVHAPTQPSRFLRFAVPALLAAFGLCLNAASLSYFGDDILFLSLAAVLLATFWGGLMCGFTALGLSLIGFVFFPLGPFGADQEWQAFDASQLFLFAVSAAALSLLTERLRRHLQDSRELTAELQANKALLERAKDQARHEILELERERSVRERFVSMLSHDLRNPIAAVKVHLQMMRRTGTLPADQDARAAHALRSLDRANRMIEDLLDASRIQAGQMPPLRFIPCRLDLIVLEALDDLGEETRVRFCLETDPVEGLWSPDAVRRIFENLATNALKYGDPERPIRVGTCDDGFWAKLSVQNYGVPLSPDDQAHLFEAYRRSPGADASTVRGWGIGLTLVSGLAQAHGGRVAVTSSLAAGTEFVVTLPKAPVT